MAKTGTGFPGQIQARDPDTNEPVDIYGDSTSGASNVALWVWNGTTFEKYMPSDSLGGYKISDQDQSGSTRYYGFVDKSGNWYIQQWDQNADTFRYKAGTSGYTTNWTGRAGLTYDYFYNEF